MFVFESMEGRTRFLRLAPNGPTCSLISDPDMPWIGNSSARLVCLLVWPTLQWPAQNPRCTCWCTTRLSTIKLPLTQRMFVNSRPIPEASKPCNLNPCVKSKTISTHGRPQLPSPRCDFSRTDIVKIVDGIHSSPPRAEALEFIPQALELGPPTGTPSQTWVC